MNYLHGREMHGCSELFIFGNNQQFKKRETQKKMLKIWRFIIINGYTWPHIWRGLKSNGSNYLYCLQRANLISLFIYLRKLSQLETKMNFKCWYKLNYFKLTSSWFVSAFSCIETFTPEIIDKFIDNNKKLAFEPEFNSVQIQLRKGCNAWSW